MAKTTVYQLPKSRSSPYERTMGFRHEKKRFAHIIIDRRLLL